MRWIDYIKSKGVIAVVKVDCAAFQAALTGGDREELREFFRYLSDIPEEKEIIHLEMNNYSNEEQLSELFQMVKKGLNVKPFYRFEDDLPGAVPAVPMLDEEYLATLDKVAPKQKKIILKTPNESIEDPSIIAFDCGDISAIERFVRNRGNIVEAAHFRTYDGFLMGGVRGLFDRDEFELLIEHYEPYGGKVALDSLRQLLRSDGLYSLQGLSVSLYSRNPDSLVTPEDLMELENARCAVSRNRIFRGYDDIYDPLNPYNSDCFFSEELKLELANQVIAHQFVGWGEGRKRIEPREVQFVDPYLERNMALARSGVWDYLDAEEAKDLTIAVWKHKGEVLDFSMVPSATISKDVVKSDTFRITDGLSGNYYVQKIRLPAPHPSLKQFININTSKYYKKCTVKEYAEIISIRNQFKKMITHAVQNGIIPESLEEDFITSYQYMVENSFQLMKSFGDKIEDLEVDESNASFLRFFQDFIIGNFIFQNPVPDDRAALKAVLKLVHGEEQLVLMVSSFMFDHEQQSFVNLLSLAEKKATSVLNEVLHGDEHGRKSHPGNFAEKIAAITRAAETEGTKVNQLAKKLDAAVQKRFQESAASKIQKFYREKAVPHIAGRVAEIEVEDIAAAAADADGKESDTKDAVVTPEVVKLPIAEQKVVKTPSTRVAPSRPTMLVKRPPFVMPNGSLYEVTTFSEAPSLTANRLRRDVENRGKFGNEKSKSK